MKHRIRQHVTYQLWSGGYCWQGKRNGWVKSSDCKHPDCANGHHCRPRWMRTFGAAKAHLMNCPDPHTFTLIRCSYSWTKTAMRYHQNDGAYFVCRYFYVHNGKVYKDQ